MEISKVNLSDYDIVKIDFGNEFDSQTNKLVGSVELDIENQSKFVDYINTIIDEGISKILIVLENVKYIDSSGLWAIFESFKKASQRNTQLVLSTPRKDVKRVLDITKISTKINVFPNENSAIKYFDTK